MSTRLRILSIVLMATAGLTTAGAAKAYPHRWVRMESDLSSDREVERLRRVIQIASNHKLTGILFAAAFDSISLKGPEYLARLQAVKRYAVAQGLEIIPSFLTLAYTWDLLPHDRNLAEGLPVKDALFVVAKGQAALQADPPVSIFNGGFENAQDSLPANFKVPAKASGVLALDSQVFHEGKRSLRFESAKPLGLEWASISQTVRVRPYRQYRLSCWVRTEKFLGTYETGSFQIDALGGNEKRPLLYEWPGIDATQGSGPYTPVRSMIPLTGDWQKVAIGFNSWGYDRVEIAPKIRSGTRGKLWLDDLRIEEVGLINVVRRPGTPVTVKGERTGVVYEENRDYAPIADPPLTFQYDHDAPPIRILPGSRIREGERLRVSYYHGVIFHNGTTPVCPSEPKLYEIWEKQVRLVQQYLSPNKYHLHMDDARTGGSCLACKKRGLTLPQIMGDCITRQFKMIRAENPNAEVYIWGDVLDPNQDAKPDGKPYFLADGNYAGTFNYVPKELKITCWGYSHRDLSLHHFSSLGFETMAAAYYDADDLENVKGWLQALDTTPGSIGIIYTSWKNKYDLLSKFGDLLATR
ncbi:MAG TPA: hypothetical protein VGL91_08625 [Acidobacteriota bacterium]|jgi:hypothetical protein